VVNAPDMFAINEWTLVTWTRDGTSTIIYKNGVQVATGAAPDGDLYVNNFYYFANRGFYNYFDGILDEIRISHSARSADYIATDYNNQNTGTWQPSLNVEPNHFTYEGVLLSESISFTDSISRAAGVNLSESVRLTDSISKSAGVNLSESVSLTDSISKTAGVILSDTVSLTDSISKTAGVNLSDTVLLTESISKAAGVNLSESVLLTYSI